MPIRQFGRIMCLGVIVPMLAWADESHLQFSQVDLVLFYPVSQPVYRAPARIYPVFVDQADYYLAQPDVLGQPKLQAQEGQPLLLLPKKYHHLQPETNAIENSTNYRVLAHYSWRQPMRQGKKTTLFFNTAQLDGAQPLSLEHATHRAFEVSGDIVFKKQKYIDVTLHWIVKPDDATLPWHMIHLSRRLQHDQVNYLDDRNLGSLLLVTPLS